MEVMHQQNMQNAAAGELAERIEDLQLNLSKILAVGCRFSNLEALLREQHPKALIDATDPALDGAVFTLPFEPESYDLIVCNLATTFYPPQEFVTETFRVLDENGVLMFSALALDSFQQLREASRNLEELEFTAVFSNMHSLGDMLLANGFVNPVVDAERCEYRYQNIDTLVQEIVDSGFSTSLFDNTNALISKTVRAKLHEFYPQASEHSEVLHLSLEFLYGAAWKKSADNLSMNVPFHSD